MLVFLDDDLNKETLGPISNHNMFPDCEFIIGIGNPNVREAISSLKLKWYTAVHPSAVISSKSKIGDGSVVMANAVISTDALIGEHCIINTGAVVEHDNAIGNFVHVSVGAKLGGNVCIGDRTWVGIGSVVNNSISICSDCMIGAGAVVRSISNKGVYVGIPAKLLRDN